MRSAIATMIVAAGVATAAVAQTPPTAPSAPAPTTAAPAVAAPAAPMAPATPPAPDATAPAAPAAPEAAPAQPEPTLPTSGDGFEVVDILQKVCVPLVRGGDYAKLSAAAGMKKVRKNGMQVYVKQLGADKNYSITVEPQGSNKNVCQLTLNYAINGEKPIISALNIWSYLHDPYMPVQRNDYVPATDFKRITNSWEYYDEHKSNGLVFLQLKKPDGSPVNNKYDVANALYSERQF
ncbi:MAG TPA: hypothetical protein VFW47_03285 [Phenylobacterium sp.]|nr:hypothetical protein [Phenylobacterium sp.]